MQLSDAGARRLLDEVWAEQHDGQLDRDLLAAEFFQQRDRINDVLRSFRSTIDLTETRLDAATAEDVHNFTIAMVQRDLALRALSGRRLVDGLTTAAADGTDELLPHSFCPLCEHAPCVAGRGYMACDNTPRRIVIRRLTEEVRSFSLKLNRRRQHPESHPSHVLLEMAVTGLARAAEDLDYRGRSAYADLVEIVQYLRAQDAAGKA